MLKDNKDLPMDVFLPVWYTRLSRTVMPECAYYEETFYGPLLIVVDYYPILFSFSLWVLSLYKRELVFLYFSFVMTCDVFISIFLRDVVFASITSRFDGCGSPHEMPSFVFQHLVFLIVVFHNVIMYRTSSTQSNTITMMYIFTLTVSIARVYIGINRVVEIYAGVLVGFLEGLLFTIPMYYFQNILTAEKMASFLKLSSGYFMIHDSIVFGIEEELYVPKKLDRKKRDQQPMVSLNKENTQV